MPWPHGAAPSAHCTNQICLGHGIFTGDISSTTPGEPAELSAGQRIKLISTNMDDYGVVVARLQAPGVYSDFDSLLVLAVGTVDVRFDEIFFGRDETNQNLPRIQFSSSNVTDSETQLQSGIVIVNESDEDLLSVEVNGVGLTLGSAAVITSQPNGEMKVSYANGNRRCQCERRNDPCIARRAGHIADDGGVQTISCTSGQHY